MCQFLGKDFNDEKLEAIEKWCSFDSMKKNPMTNYTWNNIFKGSFFRNGVVGDWVNHFTPDQSKEFDLIIDNLEYKTGVDCGSIEKRLT